MKTLLIKNLNNKLSCEVFVHIYPESRKIMYADHIERLTTVHRFRVEGTKETFFAVSSGCGKTQWDTTPGVPLGLTMPESYVSLATGEDKNSYAAANNIKPSDTYYFELFVKVPMDRMEKLENGSWKYKDQEELNKKIENKFK